MRTEFLFLGRSEAPDEDAQCEVYSAVLRWAAGRPVTIRTVDAGGDKAIPGLSEAGEANPALGLRGLRLSLRRVDMFTRQLRALARAAVHGPLKVMFPFVTAPCEFEAARALFHQAVAALRAERLEARLPELGMMVEIPVAALTLQRFDAGFFSIGANDLAQFVMACDRANGTVSALYDPMHPAMLELVRRVVDDAQVLGRSVSLCGDVAGDPAQTLALLACGLRELSMSANALAAVKGVLLDSKEPRLV
jgi:phosphotransferase system enzyme I (PtsI)